MSDTTDDMEFYSGMMEAYQDGLEEMEHIDRLEKKLKLALWALKKINKVELDHQRPGGEYSASAKISHYALRKVEEI